MKAFGAERQRPSAVVPFAFCLSAFGRVLFVFRRLSLVVCLWPFGLWWLVFDRRSLVIGLWSYGLRSVVSCLWSSCLLRLIFSLLVIGKMP